MKVAIIKYNAGNIQSVLFALQRLNITAVVTDEPEMIKAADKVIFPGVGEAGSAMNYLKQRNLDQLIKSLTQPVLGICLGMQLLCKHSEENDTPGLGIFETNVKRFPPTLSLKVPHMGWNKVNEDYFYFVHSYYAECCDQTTGTAEYGFLFSATIQKNNFYGAQFHPEKSAIAGDQFLKSFLDL